MDEKGHNLAVTVVGMLNEHMGPLYQQARQDFLIRLAASDVTLDTMQGRIEATHNGELINSFISMLPGFLIARQGDNRSNGYFASTDATQIAAQQVTSIFYQAGYKGTAKPFYVAGIDSESARILLTAPNSKASPDSGLVMLERSDRRLFSRTRNKMFIKRAVRHINVHKKLYAPESATWADKVFDRQLGEYVVDASSPGSLTTSYMEFEAKPVNYVTDKELLDFKVMDYLGQLALAFNKGDDLLALMGKKVNQKLDPRLP